MAVDVVDAGHDVLLELMFWRHPDVAQEPRAIVEGRQRAIGQCSLDTALHRLMMDPKSLAHRAERRIF